ncbi:chemotaxis protein methyltransferase CheR [Paraburkholderia unamae]|uniref:CheR family methyltransferase n=1 Tax=Paraburkholderia unamae TaxID=219649 RepID=UPI000DC40ACF|nr:protein-glutamate O-methyltransferase CheR [Paraburkholderia unamae]RAR65149.1 chemotaxis protein methyltransferase CheR [Paraburkholderia unamae]
MDIDQDAEPAVRRALFEQVRRHTGIAMNERKWTMLKGRLRRRIMTLGLPDYGDYLRVLDTSADEVRDFIDLVTTNETSFFRTPRIWEYLAREFLPRWSAARPGESLRIWSAAASSGEEAWTTAMLCEERRAQHPALRYAIVGTDISDGILANARAGHYGGRSMEGLRQQRPELVQKYFRSDATGITVNDTLRAQVTFRRHNLYDAPRDLGAFDLVLLRNVLIYFDLEGQKAVLANVRRAMRPGAVLIVGESESLSRVATGFAFEQPLIYRNEEREHEQPA